MNKSTTLLHCLFFYIFYTNTVFAIEQCPLKQKIGQMLLVGITDEIYSGHTESPQSAEILKNLNIGGIVLMGYNVASKGTKPQCVNKDQIKNFISKIQTQRSPKMFIAIDQEGGSIQRLKECSGFKKIPSHEEIGNINDPQLAYLIAYQAALELKDVGINWNFTPVLDTNGKKINSVIGGLHRSISNNPNIVAMIGEKLFQGTQAAGLISSAKHFPGHGEVSNDSHITTTISEKSWNEISTKELIPFINAFKNGIDSVMVGHISLTKCNFGNDPSSLNELLIQKIVREKYKYNGLMVTDDLNMGAISEKYSLNEAVKKAILAGNDILIIRMGDYNQAIEHICQELTKTTPESKRLKNRIEEANIRIAQIKKSKRI